MTRDDDPSESDWKRVEKNIDQNTAIQRTSQGKEFLPAQAPSERSEILKQQISVPTGILANFKAGKIKRTVALQALEDNYNTQLDVLKHQLKQAALVKRTQIDVLAEEFLKDLDSRHLAVLTEIGLRNVDTRVKALVDMTDQAALKLREVQAKNWPQQLIDETIQNILLLRTRMMHDLMKELATDSK